mmetsp:Transcript_28425/g.65994  ORF Transcript_28425/g.65994 Transcript_28425/m.65994 type:complete len:86 (-) Transcript_28425:82-339(-)
MFALLEWERLGVNRHGSGAGGWGRSDGELPAQTCLERTRDHELAGGLVYLPRLKPSNHVAVLSEWGCYDVSAAQHPVWGGCMPFA